MSISAPPPYAAMLRMFSGSRLRYEKNAWMARSSPIAPAVDELVDTRPQRMDAVHERLHEDDARRAGSPRSSPAASAVSSASGFSHSTCLPASAARQRPRARAGGWAAGCTPPRRRDRRAARRRSRGGARSPGRWRPPPHGPRRAMRSPRPRTAATAAIAGITLRTAIDAQPEHAEAQRFAHGDLQRQDGDVQPATAGRAADDERLRER